MWRLAQNWTAPNGVVYVKGIKLTQRPDGLCWWRLEPDYLWSEEELRADPKFELV